MTYCKYEKCKERVFEDSDYCILHIELPDEEKGVEFEKINKLKEQRVLEKINHNDCNFEGSKLLELKIENNHNISEINLINSVIRKNLIINNFPAIKNIFLGGIIIGTKNNEKKGQISIHAVTAESISFVNATIINDAFFNNVKIDSLLFTNGQIGRNTHFKDIIIKSTALFDKTKFSGLFTLYNCDMGKELSFDGCKFDKPDAQEEAFRTAKNISEKQGNKEEADYNFYKEMEAKRKQKSWYFRYPEFLFQYCFGYGVYPLRVVSTFFSIFVIFSLIFWQINGIYLGNSINYAGLQVSLKLSFLTMIIPAYGIVSPIAGDYGFYIIIEAILGAFMWPLFIAVFSRKYMR